MPKYKRKQSSRKELLKTCKEWGGKLMDTRKLLHLAEARADDAQKQFQDAQDILKKQCQQIAQLDNRYVWALSRERAAEWAAELNMTAYEDALAHSKTNHALLTGAHEEIAKLNAEKQEMASRIFQLCADLGFWKRMAKDMQTAWLETRQGLDASLAEIQEQILDYNKLWNDRNNEVEMLEGDLAHSDAERRKLERDVLAQSLEMSQWKSFRCTSPDLKRPTLADCHKLEAAAHVKG